MSTSDAVNAKIRALVIELVESAPDAPSPSTIESIRPGVRRQRKWPRRVPRITIAASVAIVSIASVLLAIFLPSTGEYLPSAAAAQLRLIADNASNQPVPTMTRDQWLESKAQGSYSIGITTVGSSPVSDASASIPVTVTQWSNNSGQTCSITNLGQAQFASPSNQAAWSSIGLSATPTQATASGCAVSSVATASNGAGLAYGAGVTDVSSLPADPSTLAQELTTGTTGISGIDHLAILPGQNPGFARVVPLLVGPLTGTSPALNAAIFKALALMPGIHALGETATHTGVSGLGFDAPGSSPAANIAIVVDQRTGALLEAQNIGLYPGVGVVSSFATPSFPSSQSWGGHLVIQWIDPTNPVQVVDSTSLPSELHPAPVPTALFTTTAEPGTTDAQITALDQQMIQQFGAGAFSAITNGDVQLDGSRTMIFTFNGPSSQVQAVAQSLRNSQIVASVVVDNGDT
jgi:hypothetical protein